MTYGIIHCHSEHSLKDGAMSIKEMVARAKEMGLKAITLTDHGTCTGWIEFLKETQEAGIKGIPGVEAYVRDDYCDSRMHLILLAKNKEGYRDISRAVTESNKNLETTKLLGKKINYPVMTFDVIEKYLATGNVFVTSACVSGILSSIFLQNQFVDMDIAKLVKKQRHYINPEEDQEYIALREQEQAIRDEVEALKTEKANVEKIAKKTFKKKENRLKKLPEEEREDAILALEEEKQEAAEAGKKLKKLRGKIRVRKKDITEIKRQADKLSHSHDKYRELQDEILLKEKEKKPEEELKEEAKRVLMKYKKLFGYDFFLEVQYHGMESERLAYTKISELSKETKTPLVAANDAHIATRDQVDKREFMRSLRWISWEEASDADRELYMKTDEELKEALLQILPENQVDFAIKNIAYICDHCETIDIFHEEHYPRYKENGITVPDTKELLRKKTYEGLAKLFPDGLRPEVQQRVELELKIICDMGYADYLLIVADYLNYGREYSKKISGCNIGYGIGPGRGSGAGSIVNYALGITAVNPLPYDLLFERFLNPERVSMPDIDADFSEEVREACIAYVKDKYGADAVVSIRTEMRQAAKASIRNAAKIIGSKKYGDKGRLLRLGDQISKEIPNKPGICLTDPIAEDSPITIKEDLLNKFPDSDSADIIALALKAEGTITNLGVHAAGIIISDGKPVTDYIPLINTGQKGWAAQCNNVESEQIGLLKMDVRIVR